MWILEWKDTMSGFTRWITAGAFTVVPICAPFHDRSNNSTEARNMFDEPAFLPKGIVRVALSIVSQLIAVKS
jgi:hypothetical protein